MKKIENWVKKYILTEEQLEDLQEVSKKVAQIFNMFEWKWTEDIPTRDMVKKEYLSLIGLLLEDMTQNENSGWEILGGRLIVSVDNIDDKDKSISFRYGIEIAENEDETE